MCLLPLPDASKEAEKVFLLLESGVRFHTSLYARNAPDHPSNFTLKLRKHIRTRRMEDVRQLGVDRVCVFTFGTGDQAHHLILELYSHGNIVLTDYKYEILVLLRTFKDERTGTAFMPKQPYPIHVGRYGVRCVAVASQVGCSGTTAPSKTTGNLHSSALIAIKSLSVIYSQVPGASDPGSPGRRTAARPCTRTRCCLPGRHRRGCGHGERCGEGSRQGRGRLWVRGAESPRGSGAGAAVGTCVCRQLHTGESLSGVLIGSLC